MEVREFSVSALSSRWMEGSQNSPLRAVVLELGPTLYDSARADADAILAAGAAAADRLGCDYGKLVSAALKLARTGVSIDTRFYASALSLAGEDPRLAGELLGVHREHLPDIACACGVIPMISMLAKRYRLGLMTLGESGREARLVQALGLTRRFGALYLKPAGGESWPNLPALRWFEATLGAAAEQVAYVAPAGSSAIRDAARLNWRVVTVGKGASGRSRNALRIPDILDLEARLASFEEARGEGEKPF